jgi:putative ABC transport system permease protein
MPLLVKARSFLRNLFATQRVDTDLHEEVQSHLDMLTQENISAGMTPEDAERAARIDLGGFERVKEQVREQRVGNWLNTVLLDCRYGIRQLRKNPGFTAVVVLTLAVGIGANTAVFSILDAVLLRPLPYQDASRLVKAEGYDVASATLFGTASYPDFSDWGKDNPFFSSLSAYEQKTFNLVGSREPEHVRGQVVSHELFETLGLEPELGHSLANFENQQVVVLSHAFWARSFNSSPPVVGNSITLDGSSYQVVGVAPSSFRFPDSETDLWLSINPTRPDFREEMVKRGNRGFFVVGRLKPNVSFAQAQTGVETIARRLAQQYPEADRGLSIRLIPLREDIVGKSRPTLLMLMGSVVVVLLIACANIGNLLLARSEARRAEISVRASLGATRARLIAQLVTESLLLAVGGGVLGSILAFSLTSALISWAPRDIPFVNSIHTDPLILVFTVLISAMSGLCFGVVPAWQISRTNHNELIKEHGRSITDRSRLTRLIVVSEIALSLVLLAAAGLLAKSLFLLDRVDPGFRTDHLLTIQVYRSISGDMTADGLWNNWTGFFQRLLTHLETIPGVESAAATVALPMQGNQSLSTFTIDGHPSNISSGEPQADARIVSNNYFDVMKIPLRSGRVFSEHDLRESPHVAVINETMSQRYWPDENPIGHFIHMPAYGAGRCEIIGIVADIHQGNLNEEPGPGLYLPYSQEIMPWQTLVIRTKTDPLSVVPDIRRKVFELDPQQPLANITTLEELINTSTAEPRFRAFLLGGFAGIALLLSAVGIYGVMAYIVSSRTREIGIRMALGADPGDMLGLIFVQSMTLTLIGVLLGLAAAYVVTRVMNSLLFGVTSTDPFTFAGVTLLLCCVALLASYIPARRATKVDPMVALRYE